MISNANINDETVLKWAYENNIRPVVAGVLLYRIQNNPNNNYKIIDILKYKINSLIDDISKNNVVTERLLITSQYILQKLHKMIINRRISNQNVTFIGKISLYLESISEQGQTKTLFYSKFYYILNDDSIKCNADGDMSNEDDKDFLTDLTEHLKSIEASMVEADCDFDVSSSKHLSNAFIESERNNLMKAALAHSEPSEIESPLNVAESSSKGRRSSFGRSASCEEDDVLFGTTPVGKRPAPTAGSSSLPSTSKASRSSIAPNSTQRLTFNKQHTFKAWSDEEVKS